MKVCMVSSYYPPDIIGGAERSTQILAESLFSVGVEIGIWTQGDSRRKETVNGVKIERNTSFCLYDARDSENQPMWKKLIWHAIDCWNRKSAQNFETYLKSENPDIVHTQNISGFSPLLWKIAQERRIPIVHTLRDYYLLCPKTTRFKKGRICQRSCVGCQLLSIPKHYLSRHVTAVVGISQYILEKHLVSGFFSHADYKTVVPNSATMNTQETFEAKDGFYFGYAGRLAASKGIEMLLELFARMPDWKIRIFGRGENEKYETYLKKKYGHSKNIQFMGFKSHNDIFNKIDILILPSLWEEPFGRVVIEAWATGVPSIVADIGGLGELVDNQNTGWTFHPSSSISLIKIIEKVVAQRNKQKQWRHRCLKEAGKYSAQNIAENYLNLYRTVLNDRNGAF